MERKIVQTYEEIHAMLMLPREIRIKAIEKCNGPAIIITFVGPGYYLEQYLDGEKEKKDEE